MKLTEMFAIDLDTFNKTKNVINVTFIVRCAVKRKDLQRLGREHYRRLALQSSEELTERLTNTLPDAWSYLQKAFTSLYDVTAENSRSERQAAFQRLCGDVLSDAWLAAKIIEQELEQRDQCQYQLAA